MSHYRFKPLTRPRTRWQKVKPWIGGIINLAAIMAVIAYIGDMK